MKKDFLKNIEFDFYLVLLMGLSFLSYLGYFVNIIIPLFILFGLVAIFTRRSVVYMLPIIFFMEMVYRDLNDISNIVSVYTFTVGALVVIDLVWNRRIVKKGVMTIPLVIFSILGLITFINSPDYLISFEGWIQTSILIVIYIYLVNAFEDNEINFAHISKLFMYLSLLITFEMIHFVSSQDIEPIDVIRRRLINLGNKNLNLVIYANIVSIPLIGYLIMKSRIKIVYMFFALISAVGIFLTLSRSSIATLGVYILLIVPLIILLEKDKKNLLIQGVTFILLVSGLLFFLEQYDFVSDYFSTLFGRDFTNYDSRYELIEVAWTQFKEYPIFGSGGVYISKYYLESFGPISYHNIFAQASTLGILGLGALIYIFFVKTKMILSKNSDFIWFALILIFATSFVNGMLQPMYFNSSYMNFIFIIIASIDVYSNTKEETPKAIKEDI